MRFVSGQTCCWAEVRVHIEVVYALSDQQHLVHVELPDTATVDSALQAVQRFAPFSELNLAEVTVGIFGRIAERTERLRAGDRVEIYRPLPVDPKDARRQRARSS